MRPMTRVILKRVSVALVVFVSTHTWIAARQRESYSIQQWIVRRAKAAGCQRIFESREMMWGPDGPFYGDDAKTRVFNYLASRGTWWVELGLGFVAATGAWLLCRGFERTRVLGYRGETRCGWCGYGLAGLVEERCPECGRGI